MFRGGGKPQVGSVECKAIQKGGAAFEHMSYFQCGPEAAGVFGSSSPKENQDPHPG